MTLPTSQIRPPTGAGPLGGEAAGPASRAGVLARWLLGKGAHGQVLAAFSGVIYLRTNTGTILWIQGRNAPMHRRCVRLATVAVPWVAAGAPFRVEGETLWVGPSIRIGLRGVPRWEPSPVEPAVAASPAGLSPRIRELLWDIDAAQGRELGSLIPSLRRLFESSPDTPWEGTPRETGDPVLDAAVPHGIGAALACRAGDPLAFERHVTALVGLGRGLTPSGDDFVGGLLFALRRVPGVCPASFAGRLGSTVGAWARRTNEISFALLSDHAAGHGNAIEHGIVSDLCGARPGAGLRSAVERLTRIGHSSGWDQLAGMVAALSAFQDRA